MLMLKGLSEPQENIPLAERNPWLSVPKSRGVCQCVEGECVLHILIISGWFLVVFGVFLLFVVHMCTALWSRLKRYLGFILDCGDLIEHPRHFLGHFLTIFGHFGANLAHFWPIF